MLFVFLVKTAPKDARKNYAVLMFSRNPERFIPYAYVELIRYTGKGLEAGSRTSMRRGGIAASRLPAFRARPHDNDPAFG